MHDWVSSAWHWANDNAFTITVLWWFAFLLLIAAIHDAYEHWRDDLPWWGWDLRRLRRWRFEDFDNG
jgi:hypothetical protein